MACTRDNNSWGNYYLEAKGKRKIRDSILFENAPNGHASVCAFPMYGNPSKLPADNLAKNYVDIETYLLGIGSNDLVQKRQEVRPEFIKQPTIQFFDQETCIIPAPFNINNNQRPFIPS